MMTLAKTMATGLCTCGGNDEKGKVMLAQVCVMLPLALSQKVVSNDEEDCFCVNVCQNEVGWGDICLCIGVYVR